MTFHVGQKVVCVDATDTNRIGIKELTEGASYTIRWVGNARHPILGQRFAVRVMGIVRDSDAKMWAARWPHLADTPFCASRFRPLIERSTGAGVEILRQVARDVTERKPVKVGA